MASTFEIGGAERLHGRIFEDDGTCAESRGSLDQVAADGAWTAIVLAGQRPGRDAVAEAFGEHYKALVPVCGEPMLGRVLRTLLGTPSIARLVVVAQDPAMLFCGALGWAARHDRIVLAESVGGIAESVAAVVGSSAAPWPVLVTTADHPLLSRPMIEAFLEGAAAADVSVGAVERNTVLARYPQTRRTWLKFRDGAYSGANLFALRSPRAAAALDLWTRAEQDRKQAFRLFWHFGPWLALRAMTRTIDFADALKRAGANLGISATLVPLEFAEAAIDVDKLDDHQLVENILARHVPDASVAAAITSGAGVTFHRER
jgi:GTP:adenosylcobinamide-phosphate guanylyltransferase